MIVSFSLILSILFLSQANAEIIEQVAIRVDNDIITKIEFNQIWEPFEKAGYTTVHKNGIIKMLITFLVFDQMAEDQNIFVSLETIDDQIQRTFTSQGLNTPEEQETYLKENGIVSYPYFLRQQRYLMTLENYISVIQQQAAGIPNAPQLVADIPEEEIRDYYEANKAQFMQGEERRISHILVMKADPSRVDDVFAINIEKRKLAEEILGKLQEGSGFRAMVEEYSQDPESVTEGGDLGWFTEQSLTDLANRLNMRRLPELIFSMEVNEISDVIDSKLGFHIFRLEEVKEPQNTTFEQVRSRIRAYLERQQYIELIQEDLNEQVNQAQITVNVN